MSDWERIILQEEIFMKSMVRMMVWMGIQTLLTIFWIILFFINFDMAKKVSSPVIGMSLICWYMVFRRVRKDDEHKMD